MDLSECALVHSDFVGSVPQQRLVSQAEHHSQRASRDYLNFCFLGWSSRLHCCSGPLHSRPQDPRRLSAATGLVRGYLSRWFLAPQIDRLHIRLKYSFRHKENIPSSIIFKSVINLKIFTIQA